MSDMADAIRIDIATRIVASDEDFYIVRPGKGFTLYPDFSARSAVFLDFPDLDLAAFQAAGDTTLRREMAVRSMAIRDWHLGGRRGLPPSRDIAAYAGKSFRARLGHYVSAIDKLYFQLPDQTVVIVPGPGYWSDVLIGVLDGPALDFRDFTLYPEENLPGRRVRWLGRRQKASFSEAARDRLKNPHPLMQLERGLRDEFLRSAYDQYVIGDRYTARFRTESDDYSSLDDQDITSFVNYIAGIIAQLEEKGPDQAVTEAEAIALLRQFRDRIPDLSTNISSPGFLRLLSERIDPVTIALFMALATSGITPSTAQTIEVINSAGANHDACALKVSQQAKGAMSIMAFDDWQEHCHRLTDAAKNVHLKTSMKVHHKRKSQ
ncbi:hypothetical protein [Sphingomonas glacialis]|uniref:Uncharacterized protein n=1 Tax=Sphingomonas glacialis TaxID=658225 RepID=A0A502G460_9SPHN|nr:hypothetical protein [Sphingomonas glacialis]TPG56342.1 hypothetical protein EAH76_01915 [Sphingomonas glacialis]